MLTTEQDNALRRVLRLVDLSGDLDRNKSDGDFVESGGTIFRVIDENIFEMFIRPSRHRESVETFYADLWATGSKIDPEWRSIESQSALITAEFILLGGSTIQPVQILMSDYHRWELAHRVESLTSEIRADVARRRHMVRNALKTKLAISYDLQHGRVERSADYYNTLKARTIAADLVSLSAAPVSVRNRFQIARVAAAFFANDPFTEPLDQLSRTVSSDIRTNISSLQTMFRPSAKEAALIEADAERWFERLALELRQPGHRHRMRAKRGDLAAKSDPNNREETAKALRNDARTIAFVQWVSASRLNPTQRIVFITGDAVVFDAYRRWYISAAKGTRTIPPFVLRRSTQYSPIFNPADSGGDLSISPPGSLSRSLLFTLIQQAIEAALLPLPFALEMGTTILADSAVNSTRERLALKLMDVERPSDDPELGALSDLLSANWVQDRGKEVENILESWQRAQRLAIGAATDLIARRLGNALKKASVHYFQQAARDAAPILSQYVADVLDKLVDDSILLWVPLAEDFGRGLFDHTSHFAPTKRFLVALGVPGGGAPDDALTTGTAPKSVFARAACRALETQDAANANRFATLARRADRMEALRKNGQDRDDPDLIYLQCVTQRYLISTVDAHLKHATAPARRSALLSKGLDQVKLYYGQASNLIDRCLAIHGFELDDPIDITTDWMARVRYLRALSERASLNLFMATSLGLSARVGPSPILDDFHRHLEFARGDLWRCVKIDLYDDADDPVLQRVRAQYVPNLAAFDVLRYLLDGSELFKPQTWPRKVRNQIKRLWIRREDGHPLMRAELTGYLILTRDPVVGEMRPARKSLSGAEQHLRLPLDRELLRTIHRELPQATNI